MLKKVLLLTGIALLAACSSSPKQGVAMNSSQYEKNDAELTALIGNLKTNRPYQSTATRSGTPASAKSLAKVYNEWVGTRYRLGGTSENGIDCSGFVRAAFAAAFGMELPRSTSEQRYLGHRIQKHELKQGDLVFFRGNNHVGVYMGNNQFMHASTREGVTISSLDEGYWARTYTQSRRIM